MCEWKKTIQWCESLSVACMRAFQSCALIVSVLRVFYLRVKKNQFGVFQSDVKVAQLCGEQKECHV